jgi:predicted TIM-barrel fold metal-dependent hydrolase
LTPPPFAIVDAHQHFWDPGVNYHPWLTDEPPIPFRYGDYGAIRRRYLPPDYLADAAPYRVDKSRVCRDRVGSSRSRRRDALLSMACAASTACRASSWRRRGSIAPMPATSCNDRRNSTSCEAFATSRAQTHRPPTARPAARPIPAWRAGFARLAPLGLRFDLQTPWWHLPEAARLAADHPGTQIILNHTGLPADRSTEGIAGWRAAMSTLARQSNVAVKISGIGQRGAAWTADANRGIVRTVIDLFGMERCMFASNFPVDSLCASFATIFDGFREIVSDVPLAHQRALFRDNAIRIYDIP